MSSEINRIRKKCMVFLYTTVMLTFWVTYYIIETKWKTETA